jgi:type IV secretory pathway VirB9-like protein
MYNYNPYGLPPYNIDYGSASYTVYPATHRVKPSNWIMSDDQLNRLTALAREIAVENDVVASIHIDKEGLNIYFFEKSDDEETPVSAEDE